MDAEISTQVGIVLERHKSDHRWAQWRWRIAAVLQHPAEGTQWTGDWQEIASTEQKTVYQFGPSTVTLHRRLGEAYDANIETGSPAIWVMLDDADAGEGGVPFDLRGVTVDPYEAFGALDSGEGLVERLPVPSDLLHWMVDYLKQMPEPEKFRKRKRQPVDMEEARFGKDPIFAPAGKRPARGESA